MVKHERHVICRERIQITPFSVHLVVEYNPDYLIQAAFPSADMNNVALHLKAQ